MRPRILLYFLSFLSIILIIASCKSGEEGKIIIAGGEELHWTQATSDTGFGPRRIPALVDFDNRMWVIGGIDNGNIPLNDVWYSYDGISWTDATTDAAFSRRFEHKAVEFGTEMYIIGGVDSSFTRVNEVWSSTDGISWTPKSTPGFSGREGHQALVFNNRIYVIGGKDISNDVKNDVWWTSDGSVWNQEPNLPLLPREHPATFIYNNQMWYAGGYDPSTDSMVFDTWFTNDGTNWTQGLDHDPNLKANITVYRGELYSIGGRGDPGVFYNEVMKSSVVDQWTMLNNAEFSPREAYTLVFNDKIWVIGGETFNSPNYVGLIDVWHTQ